MTVDKERLRELCERATQHHDSMHGDISACLKERARGALAELARRATDNELRRTREIGALLDENARLKALALEACEIAIGHAEWNNDDKDVRRIAAIREEVSRG
ncbi:MAG TPA: hypothetical protein VM513_28225 [Kofleriaceae bacterium]|nr:hypothetical protein [Kofleriaceae bacterium]